MTKIFQEIENSNSIMCLEPKLAGENCINIDLTKWDDEQYNCFKVFDSCIEYKMQEKYLKILYPLRFYPLILYKHMYLPTT